MIGWLTSDLVLLGSMLLIIIGVVLIVISYIFLEPTNVLTPLIRGIGIGLTAAAITSGVAGFLVARFPKRFKQELEKFLEADVKGSLRDLQGRIEKQTEQLVTLSQSMVSLDQAGISRVYTHRNEAAEDMRQDLQDPKLTKIWIIGISLNDFVRHENPELHKVWQVIQEYIAPPHPEQASQRNPPLDIRVLLIDPNCLGAYLRSAGEDRESNLQKSMLSQDVHITTKPLRLLEDTAKKRTDITFQFRFYQLPPQLSLLHTNMVSYIEPYYFWGSRDPSASMPVFRFTSQHDSQLHHGMEEHFDLLWKMASISSEEFFKQHWVGIDKGMHQCGATNVFSDPSVARKRILWHLQNAKQRVYLQGISLHSFLDDYHDDLFTAMQKLIQDGVEIKLLLLDPRSEQAMYRAFREHHLQTGLPNIATFEQYQKYLTAQQGYKEEPLYRETLGSISKLRLLMQLANGHGNLQVKLYSAAPSCFMLLVDDMVMVEQYQYGKIAKPGQSKVVGRILGKDMPLIEYVKYNSANESANTSEPSFEGSPFSSLEERSAFSLMESHFDFVFTHCACSLEEFDRVNRGDLINEPLSLLQLT